MANSIKTFYEPTPKGAKTVILYLIFIVPVIQGGLTQLPMSDKAIKYIQFALAIALSTALFFAGGSTTKKDEPTDDL